MWLYYYADFLIFLFQNEYRSAMTLIVANVALLLSEARPLLNYSLVGRYDRFLIRDLW